MPLRHDQDNNNTLLRGVRPNIVQSIRAYRIQDLQTAAQAMGNHFLYANLAHAQSKQDILDLIAQQFMFPAHFGKNFDALYDCMTDPLHKSGPSQASSWCSNRSPRRPSSTRKPASSCSTSSVTPLITGPIARSPSAASILFCSPFCNLRPSGTGQHGRNSRPSAFSCYRNSNRYSQWRKKMPTDKIVDVSPQALRMSSPFNASYWLAAA